MEFREATLELQSECLEMMHNFCELGNTHFRETEKSRLYEEFIHNESLGKFWVITFSGRVIGYIILTFGYSFEYGGRDAFVDELYLHEDFRERGLDKLIFESIEFFAIKHGVKALHIKTNRGNGANFKHYFKVGFIENNQSLLTKTLD